MSRHANNNTMITSMIPDDVEIDIVDDDDDDVRLH